MRLSGEGVAIASADRSSGNQANGLVAATVVNGAKSAPMARRCAAASRPARAATTLSNRG